MDKNIIFVESLFLPEHSNLVSESFLMKEFELHEAQHKS